MKLTTTIAAASFLFLAAMAGTEVLAKDRTTGRGTGPVVYVESQGLFYDSIVLADLPNKGRFQQLKMGQFGLMTEFGPGDVGYLGGRWWVDVNDNGVMDDEDRFFLCPLLGPGRSTF